MWKVTCQFHTYLWAISFGPGMMLSVKLSEFLVKIIDNGLSSGNFPRPTWLFVKMVLVTNWLVHLLLTKTFYSPSSLYFIFFSDKKKIMWSALRTDLWQKVKGPSSFPALLCRSCATLGSSRCLWFSVSLQETGMRWWPRSLPAPRVQHRNVGFSVAFKHVFLLYQFMSYSFL